MAAPILPEDLQKEVDDTAMKYAVCIHTQQYPVALNIITELYNKMLAWQDKHEQRFHKGFAIHNIGYTLFLQKKFADALRYFVLAYIEDLLSADKGNEDEADSTPAGQTLLLGYKLTPEFLKPLKQAVVELKTQSRIPRTPEEVIQELEKPRTDYGWGIRGGTTAMSIKDIEARASPPKEHRLRKFTMFDTEWAKRVFIGGSGDAIINYMRDTIDKIGGYDPVVAVDFDMPSDITIYHKCIALLHCCKYAIFDLTIPGGQLIEIERAPDYGVKTLAVWQKDKEEAITQVLKSCLQNRGIKYKSYTEYGELEDIFRKFLQE